MTIGPVRIGILGAAKIAPHAMVRPASRNSQAEVFAIAARSRDRAESFAAKYSIARVHDSYEELLRDPEVDAIYNPLPIGLHGRWTIAAIEAGKHVLCEKPFAANADEARLVSEVAKRSDRVVMEALHWRYHPLAHRILEIVQGGEIGELQEISASFCVPLVSRRALPWSLPLAGGALMDTGCYPVHMLRTIVGAEPKVISAEALLGWGGVDRQMTGRFQFSDGPTGAITCSILSGRLLSSWLHIKGSRGTIKVVSPIHPAFVGSLTLSSGGTRRHEGGWRGSTYGHQLRAFISAIREGTPIPTGVDDAVANMVVIDELYRAAGIQPRQPFQ